MKTESASGKTVVAYRKVKAGRANAGDSAMKVIRRNPVRTLCQIPLALRDMLAKAKEREARRRRNRAFFAQLFGLNLRRTHSCRLGTGELVESNLPLSR